MRTGFARSLARRSPPSRRRSRTTSSRWRSRFGRASRTASPRSATPERSAAAVTGSGPTTFGVFATAADARKAARDLPPIDRRRRADCRGGAAGGPAPSPGCATIGAAMELTTVNIAIAVGAAVVLAGYVVYILIPAWASYTRLWERFAASFLTLFILVSLLGDGPHDRAVDRLVLRQLRLTRDRAAPRPARRLAPTLG